MTDEEFANAIALRHEISDIEFKAPGSLSNNRLMAQVVKAALGMSNRRGGGKVIIGVRDRGGNLDPVGLTDNDRRTWTYDAVSDQIARYADPGVAFELEIKEHYGGNYVVLEVEEFSDIPVLCKRSFGDVLRDGACYVRPRRKPETSEIPTQADMRDLLNLAIEKGIRQFLDMVQRAGLSAPQTVSDADTNPDHPDNQMGDLR